MTAGCSCWRADLVALLLAALTSGWITPQRWQADVAAARAQDRAAWLAQGARNPHNAARFGQVAFKPACALAFFDPGISAAAGSGLPLEAHHQSPAMLHAAEHGRARQ